MPHHAHRPIALLLALCAGPASAAPPASGTFILDGETYAVADAIAYPDDDDIAVVVSNRAFDRKALAKDGKLDDFDVLRHVGDGVVAFTVSIDAEGAFSGYSVSTGQGGGGGYDSDMAAGLVLSRRDAAHVAGRLAYDGESRSLDLRFDLPIEATLARAGTPLPPGGGEIGEALLAHFAAMASGDKAKLLAMTPPDRRADQQAMMDEPDATGMIAFLAAMAPREVEVTGGSRDGDSAVLEFTGVRDGAALKGTVDGTRIEGRWYFNNVSETSGG
jgi:hypothetical protein